PAAKLNGIPRKCPPTGGAPVSGSRKGIKPSAYHPGPRGRLEPRQSGLEEFTYTYCSRNISTFALEMDWPVGFVRSETVTVTLLRTPLPDALTTIWKDSYSPRAADNCAVVVRLAGSERPTRSRPVATQTLGPFWAHREAENKNK